MRTEANHLVTIRANARATQTQFEITTEPHVQINLPDFLFPTEGNSPLAVVRGTIDVRL